MEIVVTVDWVFVVGVGLLGLVLAGLYAMALSSPAGREICRRRTHWTVVGGHLLMALTMALLSWQVALWFLAWSAVHGLPLIVRSLVDEWRAEEALRQAVPAAMRGMREGRREG
jgi:low temperature requirement protein LtrA